MIEPIQHTTKNTGAPSPVKENHPRRWGSTNAPSHAPRRKHTRSFGGGQRPPRGRGKVHLSHQKSSEKRDHASPIPPPKHDTVRIIPLGGVEEVGRNMTAIEVGDDIFVLDCGFQFKEDETPGIDYILPNSRYLEERRDKIRAVLISHGHLDHIGGIPYILDRIGNPPIYTRRLTGMMIKKRQEEFSHLPEIRVREVEKDEVIKLGNLTVRFFGVTHTVPDSMGIIIETPWGDVVFTGDIKLDHENGEPTEEEHQGFSVFH